jgi:hypothetical protein
MRQGLEKEVAKMLVAAAPVDQGSDVAVDASTHGNLLFVRR